MAKIRRDINAKSTDEFNYDWFYEWMAEAEEDLGSMYYPIDKVSKVIIQNKMAFFPCDMYKIQFVSHCGRPIYQNSSQSMFSSTYPQSNSTINGSVNLSTGTGQKYRIDGGQILIDLPDGSILDIKYQAIPTDEDGFPLIKNTFEHKDAVESYCLMKWFMREAIFGQIDYKLWKDMEHSWFIKRDKARARDNYPTIARMQNIKRFWISLKRNLNSFETYFTNMGENGIYHKNI